MRFVDEVKVRAQGGHGGHGCVAFLREKYRPRGGPAGGDGGKGGNVVLGADGGLTTLLDFRHQPLLRAEHGEHGRGKSQHGKDGRDLVLRVPCGTIVRDHERGEILADLVHPGDATVAARGGRGGRGNMHFATSSNQAPRRADSGAAGEERTLHLELRLLADVGLVGYPNVGKSTLLRAVSAARPRVADYPFTTLVPHLGVTRVDDVDLVLADVPGLIEGAHRGQGLGIRFLRHLSRTAMLLHLLDAGGADSRDPLADFDTINRELERFDPGLAAKTQVVVANKIDVADAGAIETTRRRFAARGIRLHTISALTGAGVARLIGDVARRVSATRSRAGDIAHFRA